MAIIHKSHHTMFLKAAACLSIVPNSKRGGLPLTSSATMGLAAQFRTLTNPVGQRSVIAHLERIAVEQLSIYLYHVKALACNTLV